MSLNKSSLLAVLLAGITLSPLAQATNGYFAHGYGIKSLGMAGVGYALPQDALAAATNPAGITAVGDRLDLGVTWFKPERSAQIRGNQTPFGSADGNYDGNDTEAFLIPEFGYVRQLNERLALGLAIYGNGGMNTDYKRNPFAVYGGQGSAGVDLAQVFITPTLAWKASERHSFGIGINYAYQRFEARGLQGFQSASIAPDKVTNNGHDHSDGWGLRLGWNGQLTDTLSVGVAWSSKIKTSKFKDYAGLFADGGSFDIPENYGIGLAWQATERLTLAADVQQIDYADVKAIANSVDVLFQGQPLGSESGPNFGWEDIRIYKLAASYALDPRLTLRAGFSWADQALDTGETFFNTLAPGVVRKHLTFGATWAPAENQELSVFYAHAFSEELKGSGSINPQLGGGEANLKMSQNSLGLGYAWKL